MLWNRRAPMSMRACLLACLGLCAGPLAAQQAGHPCAGVADAPARLACYDRAFPPSPEVVAAAGEQAEAAFGLEATRDAGNVVGTQEPERIESTVTRVDHGSGGRRTFHLENGQVWTQSDSGGGQMRAGGVVQVRKAMLGGYQMVMPNGLSVRVRRVR